MLLLRQDEAQLIAADELCARGWWWHKKFRCWFIHAPNNPVVKSPANRSERGTYLFFDTTIWDVVQVRPQQQKGGHSGDVWLSRRQGLGFGWAKNLQSRALQTAASSARTCSLTPPYGMWCRRVGSSKRGSIAVRFGVWFRVWG